MAFNRGNMVDVMCFTF